MRIYAVLWPSLTSTIFLKSPVAAGELLHLLHTHPPLPFLGRFLRFEPAKAFRTLLVSYR